MNHIDKWRAARAGPIVHAQPAYVNETMEYWRRNVLGYMVDYRSLGARTIQRFINLYWVTRRRITVKRLEDIYALHCEDDEDLVELQGRRVVAIKGALIVLSPWSPGCVPRTVRFPTTLLWVKVCGLSFEYLNMHVANICGQLLSNQFWVEEFEGVPDNDYL
ncbi:hypothetical protein RND81_10G165800 [Saponaria officinalis]|uniref:DUF4283 domain-containing protein n=1 Tax=Saponaria officinalis TaxID=3572 RepID=A0AAW1I2U5_SAPOF